MTNEAILSEGYLIGTALTSVGGCPGSNITWKYNWFTQFDVSLNDVIFFK